MWRNLTFMGYLENNKSIDPSGIVIEIIKTFNMIKDNCFKNYMNYNINLDGSISKHIMYLNKSIIWETFLQICVLNFAKLGNCKSSKVF